MLRPKAPFGTHRAAAVLVAVACALTGPLVWPGEPLAAKAPQTQPPYNNPPASLPGVASVLAHADSVSQMDALVLVYQRAGDFVSLSGALSNRTRLASEERDLLLGLMSEFDAGLRPHGETLTPCLLGPFMKNPDDRASTLKALLPFVESIDDSAAGFSNWAMAAGIVLTADGKHGLASRYFERAVRPGFALAPHAAYLAIQRCGASGEVERMLGLERRLEQAAEPQGWLGAGVVAPPHVLRAARLTTGVVLIQSRLAEDGRAILEELQRQDLSGSENARVGLALGRYYRDRGDYGRAARSFEDAFQEPAGGKEAAAACDEYASLAARGLAGKGPAEAVSVATCLARGGKEEEAVRILEAAQRSTPRSTAVLWELGRLRYRLRQYERAAALFRKLESQERIRDERQRAKLWVARCLRQEGKTEASIAMMRDLAKRAGGAVGMEAAWEVGFELESLGKFDEAATEFAGLSKRFPSSRLGQDAQWRQAFCEFRRGRHARARELFSAVRKNTTVADLREAGAFWALKCDAAAGKTPTRDAIRAETASLGSLSDELYGSFLSALVRTETPDKELFLRPWFDVSSKSPTLAEAEEPPRADSSSLVEDLPLEFHNGAALLRLGLTDLARSELSVCDRKLDGDRDGLLMLAQLYWRNGLYRRGVLATDRLLSGGGGSADSLPEPTRLFLKKITYPVCFAGPVYEDSRSQGVDPFLVLSVMKRESTFDPGAVSRAGAVGLMQLMPGTARSVSEYLGEGGAAPDLTDPEVNLRYGIWHLGRLVGRYSGSVVAALAAYNAGEDNAERWLRSSGAAATAKTSVEQDGFVYIESISYRETREYARRVLADLNTYRTLY